MKKKSYLILLFIIAIFSITGCQKKKTQDIESYVKDTCLAYYNLDVTVSDGEYYEGNYYCTIKPTNSSSRYEVVVDMNGDEYELYSSYEREYIKIINQHFQDYNYEIRRIYNRYGKAIDREINYTNFIIRSDASFDLFANILYELGEDPELIYNGVLHVSYLTNQIAIPFRSSSHPYSVAEYREILDSLLPEVDLIAKESSDAVMFSASNCSYDLVSSEEDYWASTTYTVGYDGTMIIIHEYNLSGTTEKTVELSDYDYSLLRHTLETRFDGRIVNVAACDGEGWFMTHYDKDGNKLHDIGGYIYGDEVCEAIIATILEKYQ